MPLSTYLILAAYGGFVLLAALYVARAVARRQPRPRPAAPPVIIQG